MGAEATTHCFTCYVTCINSTKLASYSNIVAATALAHNIVKYQAIHADYIVEKASYNAASFSVYHLFTLRAYLVTYRPVLQQRSGAATAIDVLCASAARVQCY